MREQRRSGDQRRAPRFDTRLWVGIPEVEGEAELERCNISATGLLLWTRRDAGALGAVRMLRLVTADMGTGIEIMAHVVRVITTDDMKKGRMLEATCFDFLPHDPDELEDFLRQVVEGEVAAARILNRRFPAQMDRRRDRAEPATGDALRGSVSGMRIDTNCAVEAGTRISLEIEGVSPDCTIRVSGHAVRSRQVEGSGEGEGERYCVDVSFGQSEESLSSSFAAAVNTLVSEAATTDRPVRKREGQLSGSLSEVALPSLLAFLELERSSGVLGIKRDSNKATIFVQDGRILDVESDAPDAAPIDSLADLLEWPEGAFEFSFQAVERDDAIGQSTTSLLMECARISDERSR